MHKLGHQARCLQSLDQSLEMVTRWAHVMTVRFKISLQNLAFAHNDGVLNEPSKLLTIDMRRKE